MGKESALKVVRILQEAGFIAYFAGGYVRDLLMRRPSDDIDIATDALTSDVQKLFPKTVPVGVAFGIVVVMMDGHAFEVATFRKDHGYTDGRRPTGIDFAPPEEDAKRRDFTINGMFYDPIAKKLYDYVGGQEDIEKKVIRAIGDPELRFAEDRLRMMRAVRYSTRFDFFLEEKTKAAICLHARELLPAVAMERVWQEFKKMSAFAHFDTGLMLLFEMGLLSVIFPKLEGITREEIKAHIQYIPSFPKNAPPFALLLELFPKQSLEEILLLSDYLKLSNEERAFATFYTHASSLFEMPREWILRLERIEWAEFYADRHSAICLQMLAVKMPIKEKASFLEEHEKRQHSLAKYIEKIQKKELPLRAEHLIAEGIKPGKQMGLLLKEGMRIAVNEDKEDPSWIMVQLKKSPLWN